MQTKLVTRKPIHAEKIYQFDVLEKFNNYAGEN